MSGLMMRAQIGVQKSTGKIRGNWGCQKGVFLEGRRDAGKWDNGVEQGGAQWSEKIFKRQAWRGGVGRINFQEIKFLNGLWGRDFGGVFGGVFLEWFGAARGVVWREEMMGIIFGWERWECWSWGFGK